jgi:hypothetical protein
VIAAASRLFRVARRPYQDAAWPAIREALVLALPGLEAQDDPVSRYYVRVIRRWLHR